MAQAKKQITYAEISAMQFATLQKMVRQLTCDALSKEIIIDRLQTVMEYHQDMLVGLEEKV